MSVSLLVTAGDGPAECVQAVGHVLDRMAQEAEESGLSLSVHRGERSAVAVVDGDGAAGFAARWCGTIRWRMHSTVRPNHRRANWFVGVFRLEGPGAGAAQVEARDVAFTALRAGGPGGQHQNTTDSAVRATHRPTGIAVVARDARSQHRNKALALERLQALLAAQAEVEAERQKAGRHRLHGALERGNPVRRFRGERFEEE